MIYHKSSIGGWAPYFSTAGIFMSSTNIKVVLPPDPYAVPTFSNFDSIIFWVLIESVYAEKFRKKGFNDFLSLFKLI